MSDQLRPAWTRDSVALSLPTASTLQDLSPEWAWGGATGAGMRVAVIDSGIDVDHPDLHGCVDADGGVTVVPGESGEIEVVPGPHGDAFGHGTACAGIIHSIAPQARITSVKVLGERLSGTAAVFLAGLSWAVEQGFDVINLSLGSKKRDSALGFHEVCDQAYFRGSFLTTAANNIERVTYPSLFASVASVACNLSDDPMRFHHNPEPPTEFLARGIDVDVAWLDGGRITTTGNSFASPHIAGIATLIRSKHPDLRPFQVKTVLWATSANVREALAAVEGGRPTSTLDVAQAQRAGRLTRGLAAARPGTSRYTGISRRTRMTLAHQGARPVAPDRPSAADPPVAPDAPGRPPGPTGTDPAATDGGGPASPPTGPPPGPPDTSTDGPRYF